MARDTGMDALLVAWAQWLMVGDGSGYPKRNVLHPEWSPPTSGMTPTMSSAPSSVGPSTHAAIGQMSLRMRNTLVVHYVKGGPVVAQCVELGCSVSVLRTRIDTAHQHLRAILRSGPSTTNI